MRKIKRKFKQPRQLWDKERIEKEKVLMKMFGLRRKSEIWRAESILRSVRRRARNLAAKRDKIQEKTLLDKLNKTGLLEKTATLDDVLSLTLENILERRLQSLVLRKNLANSPRQARQLITHGHITVDGRKTVYPSFLVPIHLENKISLFSKPKVKITEVKTPEIKTGE